MEPPSDRPPQGGLHPAGIAAMAVGLAAMAALVAVGLGVGAGFYRYKQPQVKAQVERELADAPTRPEGRVQQWVFFGAPQIHHAVQQARMSAQQPWFVAYTVRQGEAPPEVWGFPAAELQPDDIVAEGMRVEVRLPRARLLARAALRGGNAAYVPAYGPEAAVDPNAQIVDRIERLLAELEAALAKDIAGASIDVVVRAE